MPSSTFGGAPLFMKTGGTTAFFVLDHQGAPAMLVEGDGTVAWRLHRDAFGRATVDPASRLVCPLQASSQYADEESGLNYNLFRYYDPVLGRYISRDPINEVGGINLYGFCANDPVGFVDPLGLFTACDALRFVPVLGSAMDAYDSFKSGHWAMGLLHTGLAIVDATGIGALAKGLTVGTMKFAARQSIRKAYRSTGTWSAMRRALQKEGVLVRNSKATPNADWMTTDHIFFKQRNSRVPHWIKNHPANLQINVPQGLNSRFEYMGPLERIGYLPTWMKLSAAGGVSTAVGEGFALDNILDDESNDDYNLCEVN